MMQCLRFMFFEEKRNFLPQLKQGTDSGGFDKSRNYGTSAV